jgi:hypothetical protein
MPRKERGARMAHDEICHTGDGSETTLTGKTSGTADGRQEEVGELVARIRAGIATLDEERLRALHAVLLRMGLISGRL